MTDTAPFKCPTCKHVEAWPPMSAHGIPMCSRCKGPMNMASSEQRTREIEGAVESLRAEFADDNESYTGRRIHLLLALLRDREQEAAELLTLIQKYQPPGSPPPGDALILTGWVLRWWKEQAEGWTRHAQTSDREVTELRQAVDDESRKLNEQIALRISAIQERDAAVRDAAKLREALRTIAEHDQDQGCDGDCALLMVDIARALLVSEPAAEETR